MWKIGQSQSRIEDDSLVRGAGSFAGDRRRADGLEMVIVRSPTAAAKLSSLDTHSARTMPGVVDILTSVDQKQDGLNAIVPRIIRPGPDGRDMLIPDVRPLATDRLLYAGQPVAVVIAQTAAAALDAAEAVVIEFEQGEVVVDPLKAFAPGAPRVWPDMPDNNCFRVEKGDSQAVRNAIDTAAHVTRARLRINRVTTAALEPREAIASYDSDTGYRLDLGTQAPHRIASDLAPVLGVEQDEIRVVSKHTGGSFGMKNGGSIEYALALWAARRTGRPVNWTATRLESFLSDPQARDNWVDAAIALNEDGDIEALEVHIIAGIGACMGSSTPHPPAANIAGLAGVYRTPNIHVVVDAVFTHCQNVAPYRGAGRPEATYIIERMIDLAAAETGRDRVDLRRRNFIAPEAMPYETPLGWIYDSGEFETVMDRALEVSHWNDFEARRQASAKLGLLRGIGIANPIEIAGGPVQNPHPEFARIRVDEQGNAHVGVGACDSGQGHATTFLQIVSDRLGINPDAIDFIAGDTRAIERGTGTFGSRSVGAAGTALWDCMAQLIEQLKPIAADMLETDEQLLSFDDGAYHAPSGRSLSFVRVRAATTEPDVEAKAFVSADGATFPNGCHICEVVVDPETGMTRIERYTVVDDVGTVINPLLLKGQIAGGVAQGLGQAMGEDVVYEHATGQLLSATFMDYTLPRSDTLPDITIQSHAVPTSANPLGAKGAGEAGTVGALPAAISAVSDALSVRGVTHVDMPATPSQIWRALQPQS